MRRLFEPCLALVLLLAAAPARAQLVPLEDDRFTEGLVHFLGLTENPVDHPSAPFAWFTSFLDPLIEDPDPNGSGSCRASAFQNSQFWSAGIQASGSTSGYWTTQVGTYSAASIAHFEFGITQCVDYQLDAWVEPGTIEGACDFYFSDRDDVLRYHEIFDGELHVTGRFSPGEYRIQGRSSFGTSEESESGGTFAYQFTCTPCSNPLIAVQPVARTVACASTVTFTVTTGPPPASLTFQWRRNGVALTNDAHTSGVDTPTLTITGACHPDEGLYDVLVSDGTVLEPSRPARLTIEGTTGVGPSPHLLRTLHVSIAGANPFTRETAVRYASPEAPIDRISVHDLTGARVQTLAERLPEGSGVLRWDGRTSAGTRAPAGVYFVRIDAGAASARCRIVRLD